jgi:hypothetical protein
MKTLKLFGFEKRDDYGTDYYFSFLKTPKYTFLQASLSICEIPGWPYLQITMGENKLFGVFCYFWRIGFDVDVISRTWRV